MENGAYICKLNNVEGLSSEVHSHAASRVRFPTSCQGQSIKYEVLATANINIYENCSAHRRCTRGSSVPSTMDLSSISGSLHEALAEQQLKDSRNDMKIRTEQKIPL